MNDPMAMSELSKMLLTGSGGGARTRSLTDPERVRILLTLIQGGKIQPDQLPPELKALIPSDAGSVPMRGPQNAGSNGAGGATFG